VFSARCAIGCAQTHTQKSGESVVGGEGGEPMAQDRRNPVEPGVAEAIRPSNHVQLGLSAGLQTDSVVLSVF